MTHQTLSLSKVNELFNNNNNADLSKIVVILENSENVDSFFTLKKSGNCNVLICIATDPEVCFELDKVGETYVSIDDYFTTEEISELGLGNFTKVENLCQLIDRTVGKDFNRFNAISLKPSFDNFYFIKILYDVVTIKIKTLNAIIQKENPSIVISFSKKSGLPKNPYIPFQPDENLFDSLMSQNGWTCRHISIEDKTSLPKQPVKSRHTNLQKFLLKTVKKHCSLIYSILSTYSNFGLIKSIEISWNFLRNSTKRGKIVCISGFGYEWDYIINELVKHHYRVVYLNYEPRYQKEPASVKIQIPKETIQEVCTICDIDFSCFLIERLIPMFEFSQKAASEYPQEIEKTFRKYPLSALLSRSNSNFIDHLPVHVAHNHKIPVISWQYGAAGFFYYPLLKYTELTCCDLYLVWGPGVQTQINEDFVYSDCKIVPTGSFSLQEEYQNKFEKKYFKILYVTTNYFNNSLYVGYSHKIQDNTYWNTQKKIIDILGFYNNNTVFKLHPGGIQTKHFYEYIKYKNFKHIKIVKDEESFSSLAHNSEIVIIDSPTTTLLQAIASSKKKVFVLLKHFTLTNRAKELLMKRAYCTDDLDEFIEMINCYLQGKPIKQIPDEKNTEFLEEYGIVKNDGNVIERVITAIE